MLMLRFSAVAMIVGGIAAYVGGSSSDAAGDSMTVTAVVLVVAGIGMLVLAQLLAPLMKSSRQIAGQSGIETSRLTGAPKMRSGMAVASQRAAAAAQQMAQHAGTTAVQTNGLAGEAVVKAVRATGETQNLNPIFEVDLLVTPEGARAYDTTVRTEVNSLAVAQCVPGTQVPVKADPGDPSNVWLDWLAVAGGSGR